jgi:hypothetical protein
VTVTDKELGEAIQRGADILQREIESGNTEAWKKVEEDNINQQVARKLGWRLHDNRPDEEHYAPNEWWVRKEERRRRLPNYCGSIEAAWEIVEKYKLYNGYSFFISYQEDVERWEAVWNESVADEAARANAETAPMAICKAFLKLK